MMAAEDGRYSDAQVGLEKVLALDPSSQTALMQLGELELHARQYAKATEYLKRARALRPEDPTAAFYEGKALVKAGDLTGARDALQDSVRLAPRQSADARVLLGEVFLGLKDVKAAEDQFEAVLLVQPERVDAQIGIARTQLADQKFAEALRQLAPLSKTQPRNADVFTLLAKAYSGLGRKLEARRAESRANFLLGEAKKTGDDKN